MRTKLAILVAGLGLFCSVSPAVAHHAFGGEYDASKVVTLKGTVTKLEWTNPHARLYVDVTQPNGTVTSWNLELEGVSSLARRGWTRKTLTVGDTVTIVGEMARSGVSVAHAKSITLADGKQVFEGDNDR